MIRSSALTLKFATSKKLNTLDLVFDEYARVVNLYIDALKQTNDLPKFPKFKVVTWISAQLQQVAGKQAVEIIKSTRKKDQEIRLKKYKRIYKYFLNKQRQTKFLGKKFSELRLNCKIKPRYDGKVIPFDQRQFSLCKSINSFDFWVHLRCLGNKFILDLPLRNHKHNKKFGSWKRAGSCRLLRNNGKFKIELIYETETPKLAKPNKVLAIDAGINCLMSCSDGRQFGLELKRLLSELNNKQQKSKSFNRKLNQIHNYVRWCVNQLDWSNLSDLVIENLKYIQNGTKQRTNKATRRLLSKWNLGLWRKAIEQKCEENCVYLHSVEPKYTSQTCPRCGNVDKRNRDGVLFRCTACGYEANADLNASINILNRFRQEKLNLSADIVPDMAKADFIEISNYDSLKLPDGSADAWSDTQSYADYMNQFDEVSTPEEALVLINKVLDVYHQRSDLASLFITGGRDSLTKISNS